MNLLRNTTIKYSLFNQTTCDSHCYHVWKYYGNMFRLGTMRRNWWIQMKNINKIIRWIFLLLKLNIVCVWDLFSDPDKVFWIKYFMSGISVLYIAPLQHIDRTSMANAYTSEALYLDVIFHYILLSCLQCYSNNLFYANVRISKYHVSLYILCISFFIRKCLLTKRWTMTKWKQCIEISKCSHVNCCSHLAIVYVISNVAHVYLFYQQ